MFVKTKRLAITTIEKADRTVTIPMFYSLAN